MPNKSTLYLRNEVYNTAQNVFHTHTLLRKSEVMYHSCTLRGYQAATSVQTADEVATHSPGYLERSGC